MNPPEPSEGADEEKVLLASNLKVNIRIRLKRKHSPSSQSEASENKKR